MRAAYDVEQITTAEKPLLAALPDGSLMQRAATALARRCASLLVTTYGARVVVLAGSGNNGADALFAAAQLARRGARVDALLTADRWHGPARTAFEGAGGRVHSVADGAADGADGSSAAARLITAADLVIDGILGIGGSGGLRGAGAAMAELLADGDATVVAVDVPSGINASTGEVDGAAVRADVTVTFGGLKTGLVVAPGAHHAGTVEVVDIGLDLPPTDIALLDAADVASLVPQPDEETDKYRRGVVGVVAGSDAYTGAAVLAAGSAVAAGAGMVRYAGVAHPAEMVRAAWPSVVVTEIAPGDGAGVLAAGRVQAWVVGSGLGTDEQSAAIVQAVLGTDVPVVLDADALTVVAARPDLVRSRRAATLLTPHAGEFARLVDADRGDVEAHRLSHVRRVAADLGATVLLKGSTTVVADAGGRVRVNSADTPYLGTAGSGDVLSGVCGALLAGGLDPLDAAAAGAFLHGLAGLLAVGVPVASISAEDLLARIPDAVRAVQR